MIKKLFEFECNYCLSIAHSYNDVTPKQWKIVELNTYNRTSYGNEFDKGHKAVLCGECYKKLLEDFHFCPLKT